MHYAITKNVYEKALTTIEMPLMTKQYVKIKISALNKNMRGIQGNTNFPKIVYQKLQEQ